VARRVKLVFDGLMLADLEAIYRWIAKDNWTVANAVVECVFASVEPLASFPHIAHAGRDKGALEWVVPRLPYIVIYEIHPERDVEIVAAVV